MNIKLNYIEKGCGRPLIMLHGNGGSSKTFKNQIDFFAKDYRVLALDTRGHGKSRRGTAEFTIERFAEDVKNFMDDKGIKKARIIGFSDGGNIAIAFALKYNHMISKLVICGANIFPGGLKASALIPRTIAYNIRKKLSKNSRRTELLDLIVNQPDITPEDLGRISGPVLVIAGTKDMIREEHTRLIYESLPGARLKLIPGGHLLPIMRPKEFNRIVWEFLKR